MAEYTYSDLRAGNGPLSPDTVLGQLAGAARDFACDIYRDFPKFALADPIGALAFSEAVWDGMCRTGPEDNFPAPTAPPPGGQCPGALYNVSVRSVQSGGTETLVFGVPGPVGGITTASAGEGVIDVFFPHGGGRTNIFSNASLAAWQSGAIAAQILSIVPQPGQPDNCGNGLPEFPPVVPPAPDLERDAPISPRGGPSFTIPLIYVRPTADIDVNADIDISIPVTIRGPLIGIDIQFGPNGINIIPAPRSRPWDAPSDPRDPNAPPGSRTPQQRQLDELTKFSKELLEKLKKLLECACPEDGLIRSFSVAAGESARISCPPRTFAVVVNVTTIPSPPKSQYGAGQPDVHFAGWGWFTQVGALGRRYPIDALEKVFIPEGPGPSAFQYTCTNSYRAQATVYYTVNS